MKIEVTEMSNGVKLIKLEGRLDSQGTNLIGNDFTMRASSERAPVVVDLTGVDFLASIGLAMLISGAKGQAGQGGKLVLLNPRRDVEKTLEIAGVGDLIPMYDDFDAASQDVLTHTRMDKYAGR